ncbi:MAG: M50 family metallopeptidase [Anaerolineae bacterium]|nr:M50 family metallopeptidase [Anaerolineae bacterium]
MDNLLRTTGKYRDLILAFVAFLVAFVLWQVQGVSFVTYPFRLFVTMIHELGHGTSAIVTGGSFLRFEVSKHGAGLAYTSGGSRFVIIQAGYIGSALFGAALLFLTNRTGRPGSVAIGLGLLIGTLTLLYTGISLYNLNLIELVLVAVVIIVALYLILTRETDQGRYAGLMLVAAGCLMTMAFVSEDNLLTIVVGLVSALVLVLIGCFANRDITLVILNFLAFLTGLQAITDVWILLKIISLPSSMMPHNDATVMAHEVGGSATIWALVWITIDILVFGAAVYVSLIQPARNNRAA